MKKLRTIAVVSACITLGLALVYILISVIAFGSANQGRIVFASGTAADVESVTVRNNSGEYRFYFDMSSQGYVFDDIPPHIIDIAVFLNFMENAAELSALRRVTSNEAESYNLGLGEPVAEVGILFFDRTFIRLEIGSMERVSGNYYARVWRINQVGEYLISRRVAEQFLMPKTQIISRLVTPPLAVPNPLSAIHNITIEGGSLENPVTIFTVDGSNESITLAAMSFENASHIMRGAGVYQLDHIYASEILSSLFGIESVRVAGYNLRYEQIMAYGFDSPYMTIDYDMTNGIDADMQHNRLRIAETEDEGFYYAMFEGSGVVYVIRREAFIGIEYERLPVRRFLTPLLSDLSVIVVDTPERLYRFEIDNSNMENPVITYSGQTLDNTLFYSFFRLLTSAAHDDVYLGPLPPPEADSEVLLSVTYEYTNMSKVPDTLTLYRAEDRLANVFINGVGEFAMRDLFAMRVSEGAANLIAGLPIAENW